MRVSIIILLVCLLGGVSFASDGSPSEASISSVAKKAVENIKSNTMSKVVATTLDQYAKGILATRGEQKFVTNEFAEKLSREAREVLADTKNSWMPVHILLGIAVAETDLQYWRVSGLDCGLCQNNMFRLKISYVKKMKLCKKLQKDTKLSFELAMKELNIVRTKYCNNTILTKINKWYNHGRKVTDEDMWKCVLNTYNQGPRFIYTSYHNCSFSRGTTESEEKHEKRLNYCKSRNLYWIRTLCFAEGIKLAKAPKMKRGRKLVRLSCRHAYSMNWVKRVHSW